MISGKTCISDSGVPAMVLRKGERGKERRKQKAFGTDNFVDMSIQAPPQFGV
jgi:hypothetical protein